MALQHRGSAVRRTGKFATVAGVPLQTWVFQQDRERGADTFDAAARRAMEFFAREIGPYPYEKLAHVQGAGIGSGAMEHASAIFYGEKVVTGRPAYNLVAHETAHQWFGDSVTEKDWDDVWLSEGFATYMASLATEHYDGRDAFVAAMKKSRDGIFDNERRLPGVAVVQNKPWNGIPNGIVYQKGGWALHMLRGQIGTEKFWIGLRAVLPAVPRRERLHRRFPQGDGRGLRAGPRLVVPAVDLPRRIAADRGRLAAHRRQGRARPRADTGRRSVPAAARRRAGSAQWCASK